MITGIPVFFLLGLLGIGSTAIVNTTPSCESQPVQTVRHANSNYSYKATGCEVQAQRKTH